MKHFSKIFFHNASFLICKPFLFTNQIWHTDWNKSIKIAACFVKARFIQYCDHLYSPAPQRNLLPASPKQERSYWHLRQHHIVWCLTSPVFSHPSDSISEKGEIPLSSVICDTFLLIVLLPVSRMSNSSWNTSVLPGHRKQSIMVS